VVAGQAGQAGEAAEFALPRYMRPAKGNHPPLDFAPY
jgi:hypothetical protein